MLWSCWGTSVLLTHAGKASQQAISNRKLLFQGYPHCIEDNFLIQVIDRATRRQVLPDLLLVNMDELIRDIKTGDSLDCSDHILVEITTRCRVRTLNFRRKDFQLFKKLVDGKLPSGTKEMTTIDKRDE
ncbi:nedd4-binding protein 2-like 2 [Pitangus sulphuratus]|nr:nedd4-binding protein 2-like 2 [Pitangus sulphuratus]